MATRHDAITNGLFAWASVHTDLADGGFKCADGVRSFATNAAYEDVLARRAWPQRLSKTLIASHLAGTDTLYFRGRRVADVAVLMIDIDAHDGERDALDLCDHVLALFPGAYREASTNGMGFHIYVRLVVGRTPRRRFVDAVTLLEHALKAIAADSNYEAQVEVKGTTTLIDAGHVIRRGTLAKVPRLKRGQCDLDALLGSPTFDLGRVRNLIELTPAELDLERSWDRLFSRYCDAQGPPIDTFDANLIASTNRSSPTIDADSALILNGSVGESSDAFFRMMQACMSLAQRLGQVPKVDELVTAYEHAGLATGTDVSGRRVKRARDAVKWCDRTFDPALASGAGFAAIAPELLQAIAMHVTPNHRDDTSYRYLVTDHDLAIALYVIGRGSFRGCHQCGNASIQGMFRMLKASGEAKRSCDRNKAVACKLILERAGLIVCTDSTYQFGERSRCKRYTVGPNHPRHLEFIAFERSRTDAMACRPNLNNWDGVVLVPDDVEDEFVPEGVNL